MAALTLKGIMAFFGMDAKEMAREWKTCPDNPTPKERQTMLTADEKAAIKRGIEDGTLTY